MLLIRRKPGETILIGQDIEVRVLEVSATRAVLGIVAPRSIPVLRNEIRDTVEQNREAVRSLSSATLSAISALLTPARLTPALLTPARLTPMTSTPATKPPDPADT